jgi:hypothetical protein
MFHVDMASTPRGRIAAAAATAAAGTTPPTAGTATSSTPYHGAIGSSGRQLSLVAACVFARRRASVLPSCADTLCLRPAARCCRSAG